MALKEQLTDDLKAAMLSGNRFVADTLRSAKAAILDEEVATGKRGEGLSDEQIEVIIAREVKKRQESIRLYREHGREDLAGPETEEVEILQQYLPEPASDEVISAAVDEAITQLGADGMQAMGQVIGAVKAKLGNTADGATVARIVKQKLSN